jgi:hypothetical protein
MFPLSRKSWNRSEAGLIAITGVLLIALQWIGSAWTAEFDGYPDEAAQFVSGQMVRQFLVDLPLRNPVAWAGQYELHYPKVAVGHWPPGYYAAEAFWSLVFGPSRISAMSFQWALGLAVAAGICSLARSRLPWLVTCGIVILTVATPEFQRGLEQTMAELACLLCGVLFLHAMVRMLESPGPRTFLTVSLAIVAAILTKGTGGCLTPVPLFAWIADGRRIRIPSGKVLAAVLTAGALCLVAYPGAGAMVESGGMNFVLGWPVANIGKVAGWGFLVLALFGVRRRPLPLAAASTIVGALVFSFFVRAMNEPRHWIIVLPPILFLAGEAVAAAPRRTAPLLLVALLLFPWSLYRQRTAGYRDLFRHLPLPSRILISSGRGAEGEGACVAEVVILDRPFASFVMRGGKVLAESGWNGDNYRLLVSDRAGVARRLDELAVAEVILDTPGATAPPHHVLLRETLESNDSWQRCGESGNLKTWCRTVPPAFPRVPLEIEAAGYRFAEHLPGR